MPLGRPGGLGQTPLNADPLEADLGGVGRLPWMQTPPSQTPPPGIRQQAGGTHPTGMHTCCAGHLLLVGI